MKVLCIVLVIYVALALFGVEGRGGGTRNGLEDKLNSYLRARRHATYRQPLEEVFANEPPPPPPSLTRSRRSANGNMSGDPDPKAPQIRGRREMPPPPEGMPPPPEGMPPPPQ